MQLPEGLNQPLELSSIQKTKKVIICDASGLDDFKTCESLHKYKNIERLQMGELSDPILCGTYGHKLQEIYYKTLKAGNSVQEAVSNALNFKLPADFGLEPEWVEKVRNRFILYVKNFYFSGNDFLPLTQDHVEIGFSTILYEDCEHLFVLEGKIDVIAVFAGLTVVVDFKWQTRKRELYKKSIQFRTYAMVANLATLVISYIRLADKVDDKTFQRVAVNFTPYEHRWWKEELIKIFQRMLAAKESDEYDRNWASCRGKFDHECPYTRICELNEVDLREDQKKLYKIAPVWKPW